MQIKTLTKIISLILINGLTALLIFQINFAGGKNSPTKAQTATPNYSVTWDIAQCRVLKGKWNNTTDVKILLGPAEWYVQYSGDISGKEKWVVPDDPDNPNDGWYDVPQTGTFNHIYTDEYKTEDCKGGYYVYPDSAPYNVNGYAEDYIVTQGLYAFFEYTSSDDDDASSGGSYPKAWKVCKVNEFTDPCS